MPREARAELGWFEVMLIIGLAKDRTELGLWAVCITLMLSSEALSSLTPPLLQENIPSLEPCKQKMDSFHTGDHDERSQARQVYKLVGRNSHDRTGNRCAVGLLADFSEL